MYKISDIIKKIHIEIFVLINAISSSVPGITTSLLLQDKFCRLNYNQTANFCIDFSKITPEQDPHNIKTKILKSTLDFGYYSTIIQVFPHAFWLLFMGSWIDRYSYGRKVVLSLSCIGSIADLIITSLNAYFFTLDPYLMLLNSITSTIVGGFMSSMALYSYVTINSSEKNRAIRFSLLEFVPAFGKPLGTFIGGQLLLNTPNGINGQLHNYNTILFVSIIGRGITFLWILFYIKEKTQQLSIHSTNNQHTLNNNDKDYNTSNSLESLSPVSTQMSKNKWYYPLKLLFDYTNIIDMWKCVTKKRPDGNRFKIWLLFALYGIALFDLKGSSAIQFQFVERVYGWDAVQYSINHSLISTFEKISLAVGVIVFVTLLRLNDSYLIMIGGVSTYLSLVILGSYLKPLGYYVGNIVGSLGDIAGIGLKSILSKMVDDNELGKFFCIFSLIESFFPLFSNSIFITIFSLTIDFFPGLIYDLTAVILLIPLTGYMWADLTTLKDI